MDSKSHNPYGQAQTIASLQSLRLSLPPCCIEFCPTFPDYFVVGTYELRKDDGQEQSESVQDEEEEEEEQQAPPKAQSRNGSLIVFRLEGNEMHHVQTLLQPSAILDLHFSPFKPDVLGVASSTGTIGLFKLSPSSESDPLTEIVTHNPLGESCGVLFTSLCWHPTIKDFLAVTTTGGDVDIYQVDIENGTCESITESVITHSPYEAWTLAFSPNTTVYHENQDEMDENDQDQGGLVEKDSAKDLFTKCNIYSGGDDAKLYKRICAYSPESRDDPDAKLFPLGQKTTFHDHSSGVTAILPLSLKISENSIIVVTGSYDEQIRIYAVNEHLLGVAPRLLAQKGLDGGVWRLKTISLDSSSPDGWVVTVLASCMHTGARVVRVVGNNESCEIEVKARFEEHKSMNYGSDFQPKTDGPVRIVSTSFYDKRMCLWEANS